MDSAPFTPQGITLKMVDGKVVIARILHGGLIYKQGLLQVGDQIVKVSDESVGSMTPIELQEMLVSVKGEEGRGRVLHHTNGQYVIHCLL